MRRYLYILYDIFKKNVELGLRVVFSICTMSPSFFTVSTKAKLKEDESTFLQFHFRFAFKSFPSKGPRKMLIYCDHLFWDMWKRRKWCEKKILNCDIRAVLHSCDDHIYIGYRIWIVNLCTQEMNWMRPKIEANWAVPLLTAHSKLGRLFSAGVSAMSILMMAEDSVTMTMIGLWRVVPPSKNLNSPKTV